ncbi:hypothetical protein DKX38_004495 [Salix brachista]|uniref:Staygreen protein domain-containing protein n=1 Tax=Salix brachista TaxID=2182728 RepID=A0A5N5NDB2_9ROSI|nr:hypothetical protein DKX38_004495 [Salix brachista]
MGSLAVSPFLHSKPRPSILDQSSFLFPSKKKLKRKNQSISPVARLFGPSIFEASKLTVLFLGVDDKKHPGNLPRTYTLTHSDITAKLTLAISQTINNSQNQLLREQIQKLKGEEKILLEENTRLREKVLVLYMLYELSDPTLSSVAVLQCGMQPHELSSTKKNPQQLEDRRVMEVETELFIGPPETRLPPKP